MCSEGLALLGKYDGDHGVNTLVVVKKGVLKDVFFGVYFSKKMKPLSNKFYEKHSDNIWSYALAL